MPETSNKVPAASPSPLPPPLPMSEALEFWQQKIQLTPTEFYRLAEAQRVRAFTVSGLARADMLGLVHQGIETALQDGLTLEQFKKNLVGVWEESGWIGEKAWRMDNIFRTNLQTAYNVGRYKQMAEVAEDRPYWQYSAVNDSRTRPTHRALDGKVYPHDSPFWDTWYPPNGFRCRCKVTTLSADELRARGLEVEEYLKDDLIEPVGEHGPMPARPLRPDAGFASNPGKEAWQPDLSKYPPEIKARLESMATARQAAESVAKVVPGQPSWKDQGLRDVRELVASGEPAPILLGGAGTKEQAVEVLRHALGVEPGGRLDVSTPVGSVRVLDASLPHVVEKRAEQRERFASMVLPTLRRPTEVWAVPYDDGSTRLRFLKVFSGSKHDLVVVAKVREDGSLFWNMMHRDHKSMNAMRQGRLLHQEEEEGE